MHELRKPVLKKRLYPMVATLVKIGATDCFFVTIRIRSSPPSVIQIIALVGRMMQLIPARNSAVVRSWSL